MFRAQSLFLYLHVQLVLIGEHILLECARARPVPRAASEQEADCVYHGTDQEDPAPMAASRQLGRTFTHEDQFSKAEGLGVPATPPQFSCP